MWVGTWEIITHRSLTAASLGSLRLVPPSSSTSTRFRPVLTHAAILRPVVPSFARSIARSLARSLSREPSVVAFVVRRSPLHYRPAFLALLQYEVRSLLPPPTRATEAVHLHLKAPAVPPPHCLLALCNVHPRPVLPTHPSPVTCRATWSHSSFIQPHHQSLP